MQNSGAGWRIQWGGFSTGVTVSKRSLFHNPTGFSTGRRGSCSQRREVSGVPRSAKVGAVGDVVCLRYRRAVPFRIRVELENTLDADMHSPAVRRATVEAVVDEDSAMLVLPEGVVAQLGLRRRERNLAGPVTLQLAGRSGLFECVVAPSGTVARLGRIPMLRLGLVRHASEPRLVVTSGALRV
jgi:hypothetical protein